jgi:F0F1-type ATP synthase delta subunit
MNKIAKRTATRYADGLYHAAEELGCADAVAGELLEVARLIELAGDSLTGHMITDGEKAALLTTLLDGKVNPLTLEFVSLMAARHAIESLPDAATEFEKLAGKAKVPVYLRVPYPVDDELLAELKARLVAEKIIPEGTADRAEFVVTVDPSLLGGFIADCGGLQLDASFRTVLGKVKV